MCKKLFFLTSFLLVMGLVFANVASADVIEVGIADESDDAEQHLDDNRIDRGSSDLELVYEDSGIPPTDLQVIGVRYAVDIAPGSTITGASLTLQAVPSSGVPRPTAIRVQLMIPRPVWRPVIGLR